MTTESKQLTERELRFKAMGTDVLVIIAAAAESGRVVDEAMELVQQRFAIEEARFSRFSEVSELTRLSVTGYTDNPSPELWEVLERAQSWWDWSEGAFDPTILHALEAAGYDRTFERIDRPAPKLCSPNATFGGVRLRDKNGKRSVRLPMGVGLDFGGIVKGWTVDRASDLLAGFPGSLVDAGGDIHVRGACSDGYGWPVALDDPSGAIGDQWAVVVSDGAIATSGTYRRRWLTADGTQAHHLVEPRTGRPSQSDLIAVTVAAPTTETAEVIAKVALLAGSQAALEVIDRYPGASGIIYKNDGTFRCSRTWTMTLAESM